MTANIAFDQHKPTTISAVLAPTCPQCLKLEKITAYFSHFFSILLCHLEYQSVHIELICFILLTLRSLTPGYSDLSDLDLACLMDYAFDHGFS